MPVFRASTRLLQGVTDDEPSVGLFDAHLLTGTSPLEVRVSAEDVRPRRDSAACIVQPDAAAPPCVSPRLDSHATHYPVVLNHAAGDATGGTTQQRFETARRGGDLR